MVEKKVPDGLTPAIACLSRVALLLLAKESHVAISYLRIWGVPSLVVGWGMLLEAFLSSTVPRWPG
jgi:hypothetical protein